jgi:hypothetical protein
VLFTVLSAQRSCALSTFVAAAMASVILRCMVRRDATEGLSPQGEGLAGARCASPAGESPVPVSVGAPGSRSQTSKGVLRVRAGRQKPVRRRKPYRGEQARGPQHEVKPAASTAVCGKSACTV